MKNNYMRVSDTTMVVNSTEIYRHWCGKSQKIAGADALLTYLRKGHRIQSPIICHTVTYGEVRQSEIYQFRLQDANGQITEMPVLRNPFVVRFVNQLQIQLIHIDQQQLTVQPVANAIKEIS